MRVFLHLIIHDKHYLGYAFSARVLVNLITHVNICISEGHGGNGDRRKTSYRGFRSVTVRAKYAVMRGDRGG